MEGGLMNSSIPSSVASSRPTANTVAETTLPTTIRSTPVRLVCLNEKPSNALSEALISVQPQFTLLSSPAKLASKASGQIIERSIAPASAVHGQKVPTENEIKTNVTVDSTSAFTIPTNPVTILTPKKNYVSSQLMPLNSSTDSVCHLSNQPMLSTNSAMSLGQSITPSRKRARKQQLLAPHGVSAAATSRSESPSKSTVPVVATSVAHVNLIGMLPTAQTAASPVRLPASNEQIGERLLSKNTVSGKSGISASSSGNVMGIRLLPVRPSNPLPTGTPTTTAPHTDAASIAAPIFATQIQPSLSLVVNSSLAESVSQSVTAPTGTTQKLLSPGRGAYCLNEVDGQPVPLPPESPRATALPVLPAQGSGVTLGAMRTVTVAGPEIPAGSGKISATEDAVMACAPVVSSILTSKSTLGMVAGQPAVPILRVPDPNARQRPTCFDDLQSPCKRVRKQSTSCTTKSQTYTSSWELHTDPTDSTKCIWRAPEKSEDQPTDSAAAVHEVATSDSAEWVIHGCPARMHLCRPSYYSSRFGGCWKGPKAGHFLRYLSAFPCLFQFT
ncbi:unnamed protein product [Dibothriocephalus latus]|uniref:Uncharacterized protein n=1 Tax=Dibothriocephalus latus TaxID=60516 RepID=A0A3P7LHH3_DIBLA|nr:unnamed protein product [Dibothriocephalus latus]